MSKYSTVHLNYAVRGNMNSQHNCNQYYSVKHNCENTQILNKTQELRKYGFTTKLSNFQLGLLLMRGRQIFDKNSIQTFIKKIKIQWYSNLTVIQSEGLYKFSTENAKQKVWKNSSTVWMWEERRNQSFIPSPFLHTNVVKRWSLWIVIGRRQNIEN